MAWQNLGGGAKYYYSPNVSGYSYLKQYYVQFQYDDAQSTPTHVVCKAIFKHDTWTKGYGTDFFYLCFLDAYNNISSYPISPTLIHHGGTSTNSDTNYQREIPKEITFTLTKNYYDEYFSFPKFAIFCQGRQGTLGIFSNDLFNGGRVNWKSIKDGSQLSYDGWTPQSYDSNNSGSITITDNKYNQCCFSWNIPSTLNWGISGYSYPNYVTKSEIEYTITPNNGGNVTSGSITVKSESDSPPSTYSGISVIDIPNTASGFNVTATLKSKGKYNDPTNATATSTVYYYTQPSEYVENEKPTIVSYRDSGLTKESKATPKSHLKITWDIETNRNVGSSVTGCRVYFRTKKRGTPNWIHYGRMTPTTGGRYEDVWFIERGTNNKNNMYTIQLNGRNYTVTINHNDNKCYMTIPCEDFGLEKGDSCIVVIEPWHHHLTTSNNDAFWVRTAGEYHSSDVTTIESAGIVSGYANRGTASSPNYKWEEGQVYIYNNGWKEASGVYVNTSGTPTGWKESI